MAECIAVYNDSAGTLERIANDTMSIRCFLRKEIYRSFEKWLVLVMDSRVTQ